MNSLSISTAHCMTTSNHELKREKASKVLGLSPRNIYPLSPTGEPVHKLSDIRYQMVVSK